MKYISIDIETTGIYPETCQAIEFAAIAEDTNNILPYEQLPKFECIIRWPEYTGSAYAINMNQRIFKILADVNSKEKILHYDAVASSFAHFIKCNSLDKEKLNIAGKNFARFDWEFLSKLPRWNEYIDMSHRVIDPAILCVDWKLDKSLPNMETCKSRAEIKGIVTHKALDDAWDVIQILRKNYV